MILSHHTIVTTFYFSVIPTSLQAEWLLTVQVSPVVTYYKLGPLSGNNIFPSEPEHGRLFGLKRG